eukprot:358426-Chlamydomonas_euryale.AAC.1
MRTVPSAVVYVRRGGGGTGRTVQPWLNGSDGVSPLIPHPDDRQVRKGNEGTRAGNSFLNRTVPVRDAGIEPTTSRPAGSDANH